MCLFRHTKYLPCECELYKSHDDNDYCEKLLDPYPWHGNKKRRPDWEKTLIIQKLDVLRVHDYHDNGITYTTIPEDPDTRLRKVGCNDTTFKENRKTQSEQCLYCGRGGLKERWHRAGGKENYDAEKQREENVRLAAEDRKRAKQTQKARDKEQRKERDSEGCCVVQ